MKKAILISCFGWYERRLKPIREVLQNEYECIVLTGDFNHKKKTYIEEKNEECTYVHVKDYKKNVSVGRMMSHYGFSKKVYKILKKEKPDLIYALLPPNSLGHFCVNYVNRHKECKLLVDVIDMWPESMPLKKVDKTLPYKWWAKMRNNALEKADHVYTECDLYQDELKKYLAGKATTLHLFKEQDDEHEKRVIEKISNIRPGEEKKTFVLGYLGSINNIIDIPAIADVVSGLSKEFKVKVNIVGDGESRKSLIESLESVGAEVCYHGRIYDEFEKIDILAECDVALNIMKESVKVGLTMKSIDYFSYGIPVINNIKGDTWNLVKEDIPGINYDRNNINDVIAFAKNVDTADHLNVYQAFKNHFSKEAFEKSFLESINNILGKSGK